MKVHELIAWLQAFEDKDAIVKVLHNEGGGGYYAQGGVTREVVFDPYAHTDYTDLRNNQFADGLSHNELDEYWRMGDYNFLLCSNSSYPLEVYGDGMEGLHQGRGFSIDHLRYCAYRYTYRD